MKKIYTLPELENMLTCQGEEENRLYSESKRIKNETIGNNVYLRGLIEISNICTKDCFLLRHPEIQHGNSPICTFGQGDS